jgi:hypothetical protein
MPSGNQTGPTGQGPMTGQAAGYCAGFGQPGWMNRKAGRGFGGGPGGRGWGGGRRDGGWGHRHGFYATGMPGWQRAAMGMPAWGGPGPLPVAETQRANFTPEQELALLKQQSEELAVGLEEIQNRTAELSKAAGKKGPDESQP